MTIIQTSDGPMNKCPWNKCDNLLYRDTQFCCTKHWRSLTLKDRDTVTGIYSEWGRGVIVDRGELTERLQAILGNRGTV